MPKRPAMRLLSPPIWWQCRPAPSLNNASVKGSLVPLPRTHALLLLLSAAPLTGCSQAPLPALVPLPVPAALLQCRQEPTRPPAEITDTDLAYLITDLVEAGRDCRDKLGLVKGLVGQ